MPGEAVLFVYKARVVFIALAKSGLVMNEDEDRQTYPYCFEVDSATLYKTDEDLHEVERRYNDATGGSTNLKGRGWNHLPDSVHTEGIWVRLRGERTPDSRLAAEEADHVESKDDPGYVREKDDRRLLVLRQIRQRRRQQSFRNALRKRYGNRCVVIDCELLDVIEAAHINPYRGENDNNAENGLLLRADIHTLFDLDLLTINPDRMQVELHPDLVKDKE